MEVLRQRVREVRNAATIGAFSGLLALTGCSLEPGSGARPTPTTLVQREGTQPTEVATSLIPSTTLKPRQTITTTAPTTSTTEFIAPTSRNDGLYNCANITAYLKSHVEAVIKQTITVKCPVPAQELYWSKDNKIHQAVSCYKVEFPPLCHPNDLIVAFQPAGICPEAALNEEQNMEDGYIHEQQMAHSEPTTPPIGDQHDHCQ